MVAFQGRRLIDQGLEGLFTDGIGILRGQEGLPGKLADDLLIRQATDLFGNPVEATDTPIMIQYDYQGTGIFHYRIQEGLFSAGVLVIFFPFLQ